MVRLVIKLMLLVEIVVNIASTIRKALVNDVLATYRQSPDYLVLWRDNYVCLCACVRVMFL